MMSAPIQPPVLFEQRFGVTGLSTRYTYPPGQSWQGLHKVFERYEEIADSPDLLKHYLAEYATTKKAAPIDPDTLTPDHPEYHAINQFILDRRHKELTGIYHDLLPLNQDTLAKIDFDTTNRNQMYDVICGVISGFSPRDITFYLERDKHMDTLPKAAAYKHSKSETMRKAKGGAIMKHLGIPGSDIGWVASPETLESIWDQIKHRPAPPPASSGPSAGSGRSA